MNKTFILLFILISTLSCNSNQEPKKEESKKTESTNKNALQPTYHSNKLDSLNTLIKDNPNNAELYIQRAEYYVGKNTFVPADIDFKKAVSLDSLNTRYLLAYGNFKMIVGESRQAKDFWEKCASIDESEIVCRLKLAEIYLYVQDFKTSISYASEVINLDKSNDLAYFFMGLASVELADTNRGVSFFHKALEYDPNNIKIMDALANIYAQQGNILAVDYYKAIQKIQPNTEKAFFDLGVYYQSKGEWNKSVTEYLKVEQINEEFTSVLYNIGYVYTEMKEYKLAVDYFTKSIQKENDNFNATFARAYVYELMGEKAKAHDDYSTCILLKPKFVPARDGLERVKK
jgi:tetratricopeptide (TPR) repeat protein